MSAPSTRDPLAVTTTDGTCWVRRAVTGDGRGLYAVTGSCSCPEFLMATLAELAAHGISGQADVLPVPVGPEPRAMSSEQRASVAALLGDAKPARDGLLVSFGESIRDRREHEHPDREDWFCLNLAAYMGEKSAPVLRRLLDAETEVDRLRSRVAELTRLLERAQGDARTALAPRDPRACEACGDLPEQWCPNCAACQKGCHGGHDGNPCTHPNAPWGGAS